jgi:hypothetical protein
MGFGSYKTAWTWLHKLRASLVRPEREPLGPFVQMDEALVGGKPQASASLSRRVRLPAEPAQDQRHRADRRARHRAARGSSAADHAITDRRHPALPLVSAT